MLAALDALLELVGGRLTAPDVLAFAARAPVRTRFRLDDDALDRLAVWTDEANIRWGLDADRRTRYWLGDVAANTWRSGIDRLLIGVAMDADGARLLGGHLPVDDVESGDIDLAGRFAELIDRLDAVVASCAGEQPLAHWIDALAAAVDHLMAFPPDEAWQRVQVDALLSEVLGEATTRDTVASSPLTLAEVRSLVGDRLQGRPTRADFRTGAITMCTLVPMRAVPHRVVCILGLDDGAFPRTGGVDGDDLLRRRPMVGDKDPRAEDRQLLLDAVLSATDRLVITTTGRDVRTNERRPPAVPLSELLDVIDRTAVDGERVLQHHPLQPFDPRAHTVPEGARHPWAFDPVQLAGARAELAPRLAATPFLPRPLEPITPAGGVVGLDELVRFVQHPVREFLRQRLGLNTWTGDDRVSDAIPVELDALQQWAIGQRLVERLLAGDPVDVAVEAELASGALPPSAMGRAAITSILDTATRIHEIADKVGATETTASLEVDVGPRFRRRRGHRGRHPR